MEFLLFSFQILLATFLFLLILLKIRERSQASGSLMLCLPPGPSKLPLIGSVHHFGGRLPHHAVANLAKKYGPLMHLQLGNVSAVVVSSSEFAREFMQIHDVSFTSRPTIPAANIISYGFKGVVFSPQGEYWRQLKKICTTELLNAKRVKSFSHIREDESTRLIQRIAEKEGLPVNLTKEVESLVYTITSRAAFGLRCEDHDKFIAIAKQMSKALGGFGIADLYPSATWLHHVTGGRSKVMKLHQQADKILGKVIHEHKIKTSKTACKDGEGGAEDLVDVLLKFSERDEGHFHLTIEDIKAVLLDVFIAGSDTSAITIDWAMAEMIKNPDTLAKAQVEVRDVFDRNGKVDETCITEMQYLKSVIKETLRLHPPAPILLPRECGRSCKIGGYDIPAGTKVMFNAWSIGRDASIWPDAEKFRPERFIVNNIDYKSTNFEFIPFGGGRRICPGITYGMTNVEMILAFLLYHFNWKPQHGTKNEDMDMTEAEGINVSRKLVLELIPTLYHLPDLKF